MIDMMNILDSIYYAHAHMNRNSQYEERPRKAIHKYNYIGVLQTCYY